MSFRKSLTTALVAGSMVLGGTLVGTAPAQAAVYGQPGYINCGILKSVRSAPFQRNVTWECDYRTSLGLVIKDAIRYDRTKRSFLP